MLINLPEKFIQIISESHGAAGKRWLIDLPTLVREIETNWRLRVGEPFGNLSYHFVAPCLQPNGNSAVLKIGFPELCSPIFNEAATLKIYDGHTAVRLLQVDEKNHALLLEKLTPGANLKIAFRENPDRAVEAAINVLQKIKREPPANHNFVLLESWFENFEKAENTDFPNTHIKKARGFYEELKTERKSLLHGDFHHENILSAEREPFLVIDPKGIVGEIGYEISVFLNNHLVWLKTSSAAPDLREKLKEVVSKFAEAFEIKPEHLRKWASAQAVLSAWWTYEENGKDRKSDLALAEVWSAL